MRSILTSLGIVIGVTSVIAVVSLVQGMERSILQEIERAGSQTLLVRPLLPGDVPLEEYGKVRNRDLTADDMKAVQRLVRQVTQVTPLALTSTDLKANGHTTSVNMLMSDETYLELNDINVKTGRNFVPAEIRLGSKVVIVGPKVLEKLAIKGNPIGKIIQTPSLGLEIIGVLEERGATLGADPDSMILIPLRTGLPMLTEEQRHQLFFQVRIDSKVSADDGAELVTAALRRVKGLKPKEQEGFRVFSQRQFVSIVSGITRFIGAVAGGMVSIALLVGGVGIMNIMLVTVTERTREIGIRKSVGAKPRDILVQFLIEASLLSLLGGAAGVALGYAAGGAISHGFFGSFSPIPLWAVSSAFLVPAAIGILFGLYPAWKASMLDPIECLRYE
ncbi:MAG: ABC transporter permease [Acidobacteria bacterium]|nr:ABC transporter permease [Acidobacteriota bacterium]MBV9475396.1 ABC transporter permease [Acidobacteriota bacterium]